MTPAPAAADRPRRPDLTGRAALVTGASGGIGAALAVRLAHRGADVALACGRRRPEAEDVAATVRGTGRRAAVLQADLADPGEAAALPGRVAEELGAVDVLVANAGTGGHADWRDVDLEQWQRALAVNLTAPFLLAQAALPAMTAAGFGRLLFTSSVAAFTGGVIGPHYAASKAGLHGLVHSLAPAVASAGVTVNALAPALVGRTGYLPQEPGGPEELPAPIPVGRLGTPEEVADLAEAMLTNAYLTDKVVLLDGGLHPA